MIGQSGIQSDYIDAILCYCEENDLEIETIGEIISKQPSLKESVAQQAEALHFLPRVDRLPI